MKKSCVGHNRLFLLDSRVDRIGWIGWTGVMWTVTMDGCLFILGSFLEFILFFFLLRYSPNPSPSHRRFVRLLVFTLHFDSTLHEPMILLPILALPAYPPTY